MKNKEKNGFSRLLLPEILTVLIGGAAVYGLDFWENSCLWKMPCGMP